MLTITLLPKYYKYKVAEQHERFTSGIKRLFKLYTSRYVCVVELTEKNNMHYHALVRFRSPLHMQCLQDHAKGILGNIHIKPPVNTIESFDRVRTYFGKDLRRTIHFIGKPIFHRFDKNEYVDELSEKLYKDLPQTNLDFTSEGFNFLSNNILYKCKYANKEDLPAESKALQKTICKEEASLQK